MWFWIALMAFFLIVYVVTKAVVRSQGGIHHVGLQQGHDVSLSGGWSSTGDGLGGAGAVGSMAALGATEASLRARVGAGDNDHSRCPRSLTGRGTSVAKREPTSPWDVPGRGTTGMSRP